MAFKIGDVITLKNVTEDNTGIDSYILEELKKEKHKITDIDIAGEYMIEDGWWFTSNQLEVLEKGEDSMKKVNNNEILWAKVKEGAKIPTKRVEDAGYDIYACFDEDYIEIKPHETKMIPTGLASACSDDYVFVLRERGSNGSKGVAQRCGVIDSGYRNEWFVPLTNTNDYSVFITKDDSKTPVRDYLNGTTSINYPYTKGIAQALLLPVPKVESKEVSYEELKEFTSERGMGALGSSGK